MLGSFPIANRGSIKWDIDALRIETHQKVFGLEYSLRSHMNRLMTYRGVVF